MEQYVIKGGNPLVGEVEIGDGTQSVRESGLCAGSEL